MATTIAPRQQYKFGLLTRDQGRALLFIFLCSILYKVFFFDIRVLNIYYYLGSDFGSAIGVSILYGIIFRKSNRFGGFLVAVFLITASLMACTLFKYELEKREIKASVNSFEDDIYRIVGSPTGIRGDDIDESRLDSGPPQKSRSSSNTYKILFSFVRDKFSDLSVITQEYQAIFEEPRYVEMLSPEYLSEGNNYLTALERIDELKNKVEKYRNLFEQTILSIAGDVSSLPISDRSQQAFVTGMGINDGSLQRRLDSFWQYESETVTIIEKIVKLLGDNKGAWVAQEGEIVFLNSSIESIHSNYVNRLQVIIEEQDEALRAAQENMGRSFDNLKEQLD